MKRLTIAIILLSMVAFFAHSAPVKPNARKMGKIVSSSLDFSVRQAMLMYDSVKDLPGRLPNQTDKEGKLVTCGSDGWVSGFHPGLLWYLYEYTGDETIKAAAEDLTERLAPEQYNTGTHDIGFMLNCSYGNGYRLTGRDDYRQVLINGASSLATRFNPIVGCIRSWGNASSKDFLVIVDNMMNLELMTLASRLTGDRKYYDIAKTHANTTVKNHYRPDGSSFHVVDFDQTTGEVVRKKTSQGLSDDSSWARGQSWGLYGFTMMFRQTGDRAYLDQAMLIADYLLGHKNLPKDGIPYWDYNAPAGKTTPRDASAAAIMASALIDLSQLTDDGVRSGKYLSAAERILISLSGKKYRAARPGDNANFIIKHSTVHFKEGNYDTGLTYADYYFVEALMRYKHLLDGAE